MAISVNIIAGSTKEASSVNVSGSIVHTITKEEKKIFGLSDSALKKAVKSYFGKSPNNAYLHSPTPWHDLYKKYGWPQVQARLDVVSSKVLEITSQPIGLATRKFTNNGSSPATFSADLSDSVTETTETNWSDTYGFEIGQTISYGVEFSGVNIGGETSISYSSEFGTGGSESKEVSVSATSGVSFELDPGKSATVNLSASRGTLKIQIIYEVSLTGDTAVNYNPTYEKHHFWALPINSVMNAAEIQTTYQVTEVIEVGYYTNGEITVNKA